MQGNTAYARGLARAFVGALLFALPLFMTMEMWWLGFTADKLRLAALVVVTLPLLVSLSYLAGFERAFGIVDHLLDACAAFLVAALTGAVALTLLGVITPTQPAIEIVSKIAVVTFPAGIGALLADKQLGRKERGGAGEPGARGYWMRLLLMLVGALFVALNVAPTDEMVLIAFQLGPLQVALLALVSLALLHALLFWVDFSGRDAPVKASDFWSVLLRFSLVGYAICVLSSLFLLWVFGRAEDVPLAELTEYVVVLSFAAALGAGLAHAVVAEQRG
jgi:putative integral membrane protein (TIGR02587 family)